MGEFVEAMTGGAIWGIGFSLALAAVRAVGGGLRPMAKGAVKGAVSVGDWVSTTTQEARDELRGIYDEAQAERTGRA